MKINTPQFIDAAEQVWGSRWDYSASVYQGTNKKIIIACRDHGRFEQIPKSHLRGRVGCPSCSGKSALNSERFVEKATALWGGRWDYSEVQYTKSNIPVTIVCQDHGTFQQSPTNHLQGGVGCTTCSGQEVTSEQFIREAKRVWGSRWDYSSTCYTTAKVSVLITCSEHGDFYQNPRTHLRGQVGCSGCHGRNISEDMFRQRRDLMWGSRWDYSKTGYTHSELPEVITCRVHGDFKQSPANHWRGHVGCSPCSGVGKANQSQFLIRAKDRWGSRWDYTQTHYLRMADKVEIVCPSHGSFFQNPWSHLRGFVGCSQCVVVSGSNGEKLLGDFIEGLGLEVHRGRRDLLGDFKLELDIYVPEKKVAIEFNGVYWHSEKFIPPTYHYDKFQLAQERSIRLLQVWEDDWMKRPEVVEEHLKQVLGKSKSVKVSARQTDVVTLNTSESQEFLEAYHIQGHTSATVYLGLKHGETLVALAAFKKLGPNYTLVRYATSDNVRGGHSKLVSYFERTYNYSQLVTFADLSFSVGDLYLKTGWVEDKVLPPDYSYLRGNVRRHKFGYRLKRFKEDPNLLWEPGKTEKELAHMNKLLRVYDAGKIRFIKPHPQQDVIQ